MLVGVGREEYYKSLTKNVNKKQTKSSNYKIDLLRAIVSLTVFPFPYSVPKKIYDIAIIIIITESADERELSIH